ncbi:imidazoleglycerol-phosphate dehydratase HisB [Halodesulfovibrio sp.]|jgi:imidazoleglycerol-phosphate dehydratase|uniref:imidazoleglycerol-phosphate dehydratase HisB n=1 Tax=Halodesulfovibrio sp. TaxID=1912772 RepID=UPI0025E3E866|nr:imidazoleglycerol-phosphate dehydratase HisB [Halodesulfovibrio sp.]MCT4534159.1 imidazoleglycerol-phosphate dehydratase HisB [Halodesulfovibrio sp.]
MTQRTATITRDTSETKVSLTLTLDGTSNVDVKTGWGFADHMLTLIAFWGGFDLHIFCDGDLHVDAHHTLEDIGICLGNALREALGDRKGINRIGMAKVPMDESISEVNIDISGRPYLVYRGDDLLPPVIAGDESDLWREFFKSVSYAARINMHISYLYGKNGHHLLESACKGLGLALRMAASCDRNQLLSTKGSLD